MVVVPTLLMSPENVESLVEALEVRFLANRDAYVQFGLLTDFRDAATEHVPEDEALLDLARERIEALHEKYPGAPSFYLFHRPRRWNPGRARGWAMSASAASWRTSTRCLREKARSQSLLAHRGRAHLRAVEREIRDHIDTDTQLPRDSAQPVRRRHGASAQPRAGASTRAATA